VFYGGRLRGKLFPAVPVGPDGKLIDSKIVRSSGFRDLDNAAHLALKECPFHAAIETASPWSPGCKSSIDGPLMGNAGMVRASYSTGQSLAASLHLHMLLRLAPLPEPVPCTAENGPGYVKTQPGTRAAGTRPIADLCQSPLPTVSGTTGDGGHRSQTRPKTSSRTGDTASRQTRITLRYASLW
jgi:TonB family protein